MNISFFQTYGDRLPLIKIRKEDVYFKKFIENFDLNIISLHNPSEIVKQFVKSNQIFKNSLIFIFNNNSYQDCIRYLLKFIKKETCKKFFFYQDDTFSNEANEENISDLKNLIFNTDYEMINLSYKTKYLVEEKNTWSEKNKKVLFESKTFKLFDTNSFDFKESGLYAFDDSCFICNPKILDSIFDETYLNCSNIWDGENYLNNKFKNEKINRFISNVSFFSNINILGRNRHPQGIEILNKKIKISDNTLQLLTEYYNSCR